MFNVCESAKQFQINVTGDSYILSRKLRNLLTCQDISVRSTFYHILKRLAESRNHQKWIFRSKFQHLGDEKEWKQFHITFLAKAVLRKYRDILVRLYVAPTKGDKGMNSL